MKTPHAITGGLLNYLVVNLYQGLSQEEAIGAFWWELLPGLTLSFNIEPLGMLFALMVSFLWLVTSCYAIGYMRCHQEKNQTRFYSFCAIAIGALIAAFTRGALRSVIMVAVPIISALHLWMLPAGIDLQFSLFDYQLIHHRVDKLSIMFGYVFHLAALKAIIYSLHLRDTMLQVPARIVCLIAV